MRLLIPALFAFGAFSWSPAVLATPVTLEFNSLAELASGGWTHYEGGTSAATAGKLLLTGATFEEWALESGKGQWWQMSMGPGWIVEARVRIVNAEADCASTGFWVSANGRVTKLQLSATWAGINYPRKLGINMDTKSDFHTYRLQYLGSDRYNFSVDGKLAVDAHNLSQGMGSAVLMFGDLGECHGASSEWESFTYDPVPYPIAAGDSDGDGIANAMDLCATDADATNTDSDGDGDGDVCDLCPNDRDNDADSDGLCGDVDVCPNDARNDQDGDGVCDTKQCSAIEAAIATCRPGASCPVQSCPAVCNCQPPFLGVDPAWSLDNGLLNPIGFPSAQPQSAPSLSASVSAAAQTQGTASSTALASEAPSEAHGATSNNQAADAAPPAASAATTTSVLSPDVGTANTAPSTEAAASLPDSSAPPRHANGCSVAAVTGSHRSFSGFSLLSGVVAFGLLRRRAERKRN